MLAMSLSAHGPIRTLARARAHRAPRFRTIQVCPKDRLTLPLAGWKMRQTDLAGAAAGLVYDVGGTWGGSRMLDLRRRSFITLLGGAAAAWPIAASAQQSLRRIAVVLASRETDSEDQARLRGLMQGLQLRGWMDGRNVRIDLRWAGGSMERTREIAAEFVALTPDVIVCAGSVATAAMKRATSSIPVVFALVNEPDTQGFVASLARPGGNITGFTNMDFTVIGKSLELLKSIVPALSRIGLMFNSDAYPLYENYLRIFQSEPRRPVEVVRASVRSTSEIEAAISALASSPGSGLAVLPDSGFTVANRAIIQAALDRHRMPSITPWRQFVSDGALMSYGPDSVDIFRRAADYVDRILKGAKPTELPVQQPVKFELVINLKTARALGLDVPVHLQQLADEVIE
jgi:putative ABC transport system substrate-binding protein